MPFFHNAGILGGRISDLPHIYIIDDNKSFGRSLKRLLLAEGYSADLFHSARSFFDTVPAHADGCAIVDIWMPECDGFATVDKMRELRYRMRFIMITGHAQKNTREIALQKGALGLLQKPFGEESLISLLELLGKVTKGEAAEK